MKKHFFIASIFISIIYGCAPSTEEFQKEEIFDFKNSHLKFGLEFEKKINSKDISRTRRVGLGEGIYPNKNNFKLEISRNFKRIKNPDLLYKADYHFTKDSTIRVIMYEWNRGKKKGYSKSEKQQSEKVLNIKFTDLRKTLDNYFGQPYLIDFPKDSLIKNASRDGIKWRNGDGLNAYLFAFRDRKNNYSQIRLSMYPE